MIPLCTTWSKYNTNKYKASSMSWGVYNIPLCMSYGVYKYVTRCVQYHQTGHEAQHHQVRHEVSTVPSNVLKNVHKAITKENNQTNWPAWLGPPQTAGTAQTLVHGSSHPWSWGRAQWSDTVHRSCSCPAAHKKQISKAAVLAGPHPSPSIYTEPTRQNRLAHAMNLSTKSCIYACKNSHIKSCQLAQQHPSSSPLAVNISIRCHGKDTVTTYKKLTHRHQVFDDVHVRQRVDLDRLLGVAVDLAADSQTRIWCQITTHTYTWI